MATPLISERGLLSSVSPIVLNLSLDEANQEYFFTLPSGIRQFLIKPRDIHHTIKFCFTEGESNSNYITLKGGYWETTVLLRDLKIYCQSPDAGCIIEFMGWQ